tara:strand:- start:34 stop:1047 length:1014 start_codon:yes stop_codon:yes gene_type:complete
MTAKEILGNKDYPAIAYGGCREVDRDLQPTIDQIKEDLRLLSAIGYKVLRTYNVHYTFASNLLKAITELKQDDADFEMYVMLGAWIECKSAWTENANHSEEDLEKNTKEINEAVRLANQYPEIVKIISVGNEAMVHWAKWYFVEPKIILRWVKYLQELKAGGQLDSSLWITSSDNWAAWGGDSKDYHKPELNELIKEVDYISIHTYPFHDTFYKPEFWRGIKDDKELIDKSVVYAAGQFESVRYYLDSLGIDKPIHIGETGWSTSSPERFNKIADESKQSLYYHQILEWGKQMGITIFYFSAFDEPWKAHWSAAHSENHFGIFNVKREPKSVFLKKS